MKTHLTKYLLVLAGCALVCGTVRSEEKPVPSVNQQQPEPNLGDTPAQRFVWEAGCGSLKEIKLSEMAVRRSPSAQVREFAQTMLRDHGKANTELRQLARQKDLEFPSADYFRATNITDVVSVEKHDGESSLNTKEISADVIAYKPLEGRITDAPVFAGSAARARYALVQSETRETMRKLEAASDAEFDRIYVDALTRDHAEAIRKFENAAEDLADADLKEFAASTLPTLRDHYDHVKGLGKDLVANGQ